MPTSAAIQEAENYGISVESLADADRRHAAESEAEKINQLWSPVIWAYQWTAKAVPDGYGNRWFVEVDVDGTEGLIVDDCRDFCSELAQRLRVALMVLEQSKPLADSAGQCAPA